MEPRQEYRAKRVRPLFRLRSKKLGEHNGFVEEITGGQRTTKAYHREQAVIDRFDVKNGETVQAYAEADYYAYAMGPSVNFVNNLSLTLISVFGALLYMKGAISLGDISSFVLYSRKFSGLINEFANLLAEMQSTFSAAERVFHLLDEQPEPADAPDTRSLCDVRGDVSLSHVRFGYDPGCPVLTDLMLHAKSGSVTAIVGPTGAGKTTIINLLMRFYDAERGTITIDGQDIRSLTRKSLRLAYLTFTKDEQRVLKKDQTSVEDKKDSYLLQFITGAQPLSNWDQYVSELNGLGLEQCLEVYNAAYARYLEAQNEAS